MKYKIKTFTFFLFVICVLALGIREVNYNNYQIIEKGTKEVIAISVNDRQANIKIFGENIVVNENIGKKIDNIIEKFNK